MPWTAGYRLLCGWSGVPYSASLTGTLASLCLLVDASTKLASCRGLWCKRRRLANAPWNDVGIQDGHNVETMSL